MSKCLYCYNELGEGDNDFHKRCFVKFFGEAFNPIVEYSHSDLNRLGTQIIESKTTLTGVQPKLSLHLSKDNGIKKLTIVGLPGNYIMKAQADGYPQLPENEDLTMHLAAIARIRTVEHTLIRLKDRELAYLTKRVDRLPDGGKIAMEDMCQLTEHQTENKYKSSYEQIAKTIQKYSGSPQMDLVSFYETVIFSFLTGNSDMHLKNFSLYNPTGLRHTLSPAYDLLNTAIANPDDQEELALTLNGKKSRIKASDFIASAARFSIKENVIRKIIANYGRIAPKWYEFIDKSFLSDDMKASYKALISTRIQRLMDV